MPKDTTVSVTFNVEDQMELGISGVKVTKVHGSKGTSWGMEKPPPFPHFFGHMDRSQHCLFCQGWQEDIQGDEAMGFEGSHCVAAPSLTFTASGKRILLPHFAPGAPSQGKGSGAQAWTCVDCATWFDHILKAKDHNCLRVVPEPAVWREEAKRYLCYRCENGLVSSGDGGLKCITCSNAYVREAAAQSEGDTAKAVHLLRIHVNENADTSLRCTDCWAFHVGPLHACSQHLHRTKGTPMRQTVAMDTIKRVHEIVSDEQLRRMVQEQARAMVGSVVRDILLAPSVQTQLVQAARQVLGEEVARLVRERITANLEVVILPECAKPKADKPARAIVADDAP